MKLNYWAPHVTVTAIVKQENRFLLVEEIVDGKKVINQPAGHLESNESLLDAVIRETLEESRWDFLPEYISGIYRWVHENGETYLRVCFVGHVSKEHKELNFDSGIERALWLTEEEIRNHKHLRSPLVLECIEDYLSGNNYPLSLIKDIS